MKLTTITRKGQVTIPKDVRDALSVKENAQVIFVVVGGTAIMKVIPRTTLGDLYGILRGGPPIRGRAAEREAVPAFVASHALMGTNEDE